MSIGSMDRTATCKPGADGCASLAETVAGGFSILISCTGCTHCRVVPAKPLLDLFRANVWVSDLRSVGSRMRCRCGLRQPAIRAIDQAPDGAALGPTTEAAYKALIRRLRD